MLHVDKSHWICVSTIGCTFGELNVYDSRLTTLSPATLKVICSLLHCSKSDVTVNIMQLQQQTNGSDCGVYAIACAASLCNGDEPSDQCWDEKSCVFISFSVLKVPLCQSFQRQLQRMKVVHNVPPHF